MLELGDGVFEVLSTEGDTHLGGDDVDQKIINWLAEEFKSEEDIDLRKDPMALQRLKKRQKRLKLNYLLLHKPRLTYPISLLQPAVLNTWYAV